MASHVPLSHMPLEPKWRHRPTFVYNKNYAYGINYYQPMIDYIDERENRARAKSEYPHLPWSDSRALWEDKKVQTYTPRDLQRLAVDAEVQAKDHLSTFKVAKRSDFSLSKTIHASHVTKEIFPRKRVICRPVQVRPRSEPRKIERKIMSDLELGSLQDVQTIREVKDALEHGRRLRGKSAKAIEFHLKADALQNLSQSQELADIRKFQRNAVHVLMDDRMHSQFMSNRARMARDDQKFLEPLDNLSHELKEFEQKSSGYFLDKR
ncbi:paramyosin, short form [Neodiprion pinetum]|uniref:paramyosin, short form n=1 Tax=Neodiprion pinetum TaxID=441929 RepID=UPI001EDD285D|nr:paramyosin, short form-like [Neodiprion pinetum]